MADHLGCERHDPSLAAGPEAIYPVVLIDAIVLKVQDEQVANRPLYIAMRISVDGKRAVLGMWGGPSGGEGAKPWMNMLTEPRNQWVEMPTRSLSGCPAQSPAAR